MTTPQAEKKKQMKIKEIGFLVGYGPKTLYGEDYNGIPQFVTLMSLRQAKEEIKEMVDGHVYQIIVTEII